MLILASAEDYARGFTAGWRDRAEVEHRRGGLTFDDGVKVGYEQGYTAGQASTPPPATCPPDQRRRARRSRRGPS
jgi:hypothetical protein